MAHGRCCSRASAAGWGAALPSPDLSTGSWRAPTALPHGRCHLSPFPKENTVSCPKCGLPPPSTERQPPGSPSAHFILVRGAQLIPGFRIIFPIPAARSDEAISTCKEDGGDNSPPTPLHFTPTSAPSPCAPQK